MRLISICLVTRKIYQVKIEDCFYKRTQTKCTNQNLTLTHANRLHTKSTGNLYVAPLHFFAIFTWSVNEKGVRVYYIPGTVFGYTR